ncbi:hypothetical protein DFH29DRAFT_1002482 [Suillus ampliporus]|nr:hypothetical protein DFH29DRAFT_1002482 [Suillus ampliporus]
MDYDVDDDALRDLEAGLYLQRRHTRDASDSDSWLTNMPNSFIGIFHSRFSSHQHSVPNYAEDVDTNDEDLTGMKVMFQMDSCPTNFVTHVPNQFYSGSPVSSCPSAVSRNSPADSSVGILHSTSLEIAESQFNLSLSSHISRNTPTPPLEPEHAADRRSIEEGKLPERPRCVDSLIADVAQPPWRDDEFEEWYLLEYTLKLGRGDLRSSASKHHSARESSNSRECSVTPHLPSVSPSFHTTEDEEYYHWKRKHRNRERKQTRRRQAMTALLSKSDDLGWIDADEVRTW